MVDRLRTKRDHVHDLIQHPPEKELELSYDDISIISRYLAAGRSFNQSFDVYLRQILSVSNEPAVQIRTKGRVLRLTKIGTAYGTCMLRTVYFR